MAGKIADAIDDVDLQARCCYYLAYVVSHHGEWEQALELTSRSRALYDGLDRPWDQAANALFASRAAISAGDEQRSLEAAAEVEQWLAIVEDPWLHVRRDAMLGELARIQHRYDDAVLYIGRAAETSQLLGFRQTEAYQVSSLGRAQCQAGDYETGAATLELAIDKAEATGDLRLAALARVHLGRVLRARGQRSTKREQHSMPRAPGTAMPAAENRPRSGSVSSPQWTPPTAQPDTRRPPQRDPRGGAAQRRCPRRGLRPRRARAHRGGRWRLPRERAPCAKPPTTGSPPRRTSSRNGTGSTPADRRDRQRIAPEPSPARVISRSCSAARRRAPRSLSRMNASSPPVTIAIPTS